MIHDNPLRGKQIKTAKEKRDDSSIIIAALGELERRKREAEAAGDRAALERVAMDYRAIGCVRLANGIMRNLPKEVTETQ